MIPKLARCRMTGGASGSLVTGLCLLLLGIFADVMQAAPGKVTWTTNYYTVTGASFRDIRTSIARNRPWRGNFDAETRWNVEWKFTVGKRSGNCVCTDHTVTTTITTVMPIWTPPAEATEETRERWARYFRALMEHETGHAAHGKAAAAEISGIFSQPADASSCGELTRILSERVQAVIDDYRRRDLEHDRRPLIAPRSGRTASPLPNPNPVEATP